MSATQALAFRSKQVRECEMSLRFWFEMAQHYIPEPDRLWHHRTHRFVEYCAECVWHYDAMVDLAKEGGA